MFTSRTTSKQFWSGGKGSWKVRRQCEKSKGIISMLNQRQCCQNLLFFIPKKISPYSQRLLLLGSNHQLNQNQSHSKGCMHHSCSPVICTGMPTCAPTVHVPAVSKWDTGKSREPCPAPGALYRGTTPSRGDPQDHLFFPVIPTLSTARYFCLPQPQLLHRDMECASSASLECKLKLMGQKVCSV